MCMYVSRRACVIQRPGYQRRIMRAGRLWMRIPAVGPPHHSHSHTYTTPAIPLQQTLIHTHTHHPSHPTNDQRPGTRLHEVRRIAPEFYMSMPHYYSWTKVIWDFVADPHLTPFK